MGRLIKMVIALMVGILALSFSQPVYATEEQVEYENNDTFDTANIITLGVVYRGVLTTTSDRDYYKVVLTEGTEYQILITNADKIYATRLVLPDKNHYYGIWEHSTYDGIAEAYKCVFIAPETGSYYVYISN